MMVHFVTQSTSNKVLEAQLFALLCLNSKADAEKGKSKAQGWGSFKNYVDKIRWVGGQKRPILVHVQGKKCPSRGRYVVKTR